MLTYIGILAAAVGADGTRSMDANSALLVLAGYCLLALGYATWKERRRIRWLRSREDGRIQAHTLE